MFLLFDYCESHKSELDTKCVFMFMHNNVRRTVPALLAEKHVGLHEMLISLVIL
jgi:hypothetical protein